MKFDKITACSSAAGGLKMVAIGLVEELTTEAARRVCLGAGAKVDLVLSHRINHHEVDQINEKNIDIILDKNLQNIKETTLFLKDTATNQLDFYKSDTKKEKINLYNEINFLIKMVEMTYLLWAPWMSMEPFN